MSRNNDQRSGAKKKSTTPAAIAAPSSQNQPFSFVVPTELVDLPSKGEFYPEGHPLHGKDVIEIRHMTAKDEDILTSKSLLKKGVAIDKLLKSVIVDKSIDPNSLLVGDKNALLVATRASGYGVEYKTDVQCPNCGTRNRFEFNISDPQVFSPSDEFFEEENIERGPDGTFVLDLPRSKVCVTIRLLNGYDEKKLAERIKQRRKARMPESNATEQFRLIITAVNGDESKSSINQFISMMPALDSKYLRSLYKRLNPNIDLTQEFCCSECDFEGPMEVPFTADFLWPKQ